MKSGVIQEFVSDMRRQELYKSQYQVKYNMTRYNILRKGKVVFWNVTESELFDRLEDYAVEQYVTGEQIAKEITYVPVKEED